jgi:ABC-type multidrug transport system fused ATPase/permease subunit
LIFSEVFNALADTDVQKQTDDIRIYTYTIFLVGVGGAISQLVSSLTLAKSGEELTLRMRIISFKSMLRQEIGWFDLDENNLGALVTRLSSDAASLKGFTGPTLTAVFNATGALIAGLVISFTAGWKLTLVILCFSPLMVFSGIIQGQQISKAGQKKASTSDAEDGGKVCLHRFAYS